MEEGETGRLKDRSGSFMAKSALANGSEAAFAAEREVQKMKRLADLRQKMSPSKEAAGFDAGPSGADASASADFQRVPEMPQAKDDEGAPAPSLPEAQAVTQTTDQKLDKIMDMMKNVAVKNDLFEMKQSLLKEVEINTKVAIAEAVDPVKSEIHDLKSRVGAVEQGVNVALEHRIKDIEATISELKISPASGNKDQSTAVDGGLEGASTADAAISWLSGVMNKVGVEGVLDVYDKCQGRTFNGMVFVKFGSAEKRDAAITTFNKNKNAFNETRTFMNQDRPLQERTKFSFLLNFKKLLIEWGFDRISFEEGSGTISVAGLPVLKVSTDGFAFKTVWLEDSWGQWKDVTNDQKFKTLIQTAEDKLKKASRSKGKGKDGSS